MTGLSIRKTETGDLLLTASNAVRAEIAYETKRGRDYWSIMAELFESYACNGSFTHFDAGAANPFVGLTSAPCVAESMSYRDDGEAEIDGAFWYFDQYAIVDDLDELKNCGRVIYKLAA